MKGEIEVTVQKGQQTQKGTFVLVDNVGKRLVSQDTTELVRITSHVKIGTQGRHTVT